MNAIRDGFIVMVFGGIIWVMLLSSMLCHEISWSNNKSVIKTNALVGLFFVLIGYIIILLG